MSTSLMRRNRFDVWNPVSTASPWRALEELQSRMWDWMTTPTGITPMSRLFNETAAYVPPVDVYEVADELFVAANLPGIDPSKIDLQVQSGCLTISGEQNPVIPESGNGNEGTQVRTHLAGIPRYGRFSFRLALPFEVNADSANATYQDGLLRIRFSKPEHVKAKRISINVQPADQAISPAPAAQIEASAKKE